MSIEAMKQALEALDEVTGWTWAGPMRVMDEVEDAITSLRQAIAEAEKQEPVQVAIKDFVKAVEGKEEMVGRPVYWAQWPNDDTHPQPKREPLTIEQLREHWQVAKVLDMTDAEIDFADYVLIARDVEALHGIKGE